MNFFTESPTRIEMYAFALGIMFGRLLVVVL